MRVNIIFLILCSLALSSAGCSREEAVDENAFQTREWAFLFYDDAVVWSAPCLMGAIECMYEIRHQTKIYVGSEAVSGYCYWKYALKDIREILTSSPHIDTLELGNIIISCIEDNLWMVENEYYGQSRFITMSAVRTDKIQGLVALFDEIVRYYADHPVKYNTYLNGRYDEIETYGENNDFNMDMHSLAAFLLNRETDPGIVSRLRELQNEIEEAVIAETHGWMYPDSHGIAIHHPNVDTFFLHDEWNGWYQQVEFAQDTRWDDIMINYLGIQTTSVAPESGTLLEWMRKMGSGEVLKIPMKVPATLIIQLHDVSEPANVMVPL